MAVSDHGRGADQYMLRMSDGLRSRIKEAAEASNRSMNAEINIRLESSFSDTTSLHHEIASLIDRRVQAEVSSRLAKIAASIGAAT